MSTMLLACKLSRPRRGFWSRAKNLFGVALWYFGRSYYCHAELVFSSRHQGQSFSSVPEGSESDPKGGPRFAQLAFDSRDWDVWEIPHVCGREEDEAFQHAKELLGPEHNYDAQGLGSFVAPGVVKPSAANLWCSEAVAEVAQRAGLFLHLTPEKTTPDDLAEVAIACGWKKRR